MEELHGPDTTKKGERRDYTNEGLALLNQTKLLINL